MTRTPANECYSCKHKRNIPGDCHIACGKPDSTMRGDNRAIIHGWFWYPINFDPCWKQSLCRNFESLKEVKSE